MLRKAVVEEDDTMHEEEGEHNSDGDAGEEESELSPKRQKTAAKAGANGGFKQMLQELQKQKNAAVKSEDYAEAMRIKAEINTLKEKAEADKKAAADEQASIKAKAAEEKAAAQAAKRKASEAMEDTTCKSGNAAKKPTKQEPQLPPVEELELDPFFDVKTATLLAPNDLTAKEREAWRAVHTGNLNFLGSELIGSDVPLFCMRDVIGKQTALHLAIEKGNTRAISMLCKQLHSAYDPLDTPRKRASSMATQSTGTMNVLTLGFETGKIGAARGGKELNNALVDPNDKPEPLQEVIGRAELSRDQLRLLMSLGAVNLRAVVRRNKLIVRGRGGTFICDLTECLEPAMRFGHLEVVREILEKTAVLGVGPAHMAAVNTEPFPEKMQARSVTAKMRYGGQMTPVHVAAINADESKLAALLKLEPTALSMLTDQGHHPIHYAAACQGSGPLKLLLSEWNVERTLVGPDKRSALHFAARAGRAANIRVLMGGESIGPGASISFAKEIRAVLMRQKAATVKIGNDGTCILSHLLVDLTMRISADAAERLKDAPMLGLKALHQATRKVLQGKLSSKIAQQAGKLTAGKGGLTRAGSELVQTLNDASEEVLRIMFNKIDANNDGKLDRKEIEAVFTSANMKLSKKAFAGVVKKMDLDGNGNVSLEEFSAWMEAKSAHAATLRSHLLVATGAMEQGELAQAEAEEEKELLEGVEKLAFNTKPLLQMLEYVGNSSDDFLEQNVAYTSAVLECACTKVLEVSANAARSQKKPTVTPEHIMNSVRSNEELQGLVQRDSVVMNALLLPMKDREGNTCLHMAAEMGHTAAVETLIACGADVDAAGLERKTALCFAAERGHAGCVRALLAAGAKTELADKRKRTPCLLAAKAGQTVVASILLHKHANPNAADDSGNTIVHYAAAFGWVDCLSLLHKAGAELSVTNQMKLAPITAALQKGHKTVFRCMLELGIDVNFRDADGSTLLLGCLGTANRFVHEEIQFMMSKGADPALASSQGTTPMHAVAQASIHSHGISSFFVAHPFEAERLQRVMGWSARPKPQQMHEIDEEEEEEEEEEDEDEDEVDGDCRAPKPQKAAPAGEEKLDEKVYRRGFHQLTTLEREAVFRLGWNQQQWQAGDNPVMPWGSLNQQQRDGAKLLGLEEAVWPFMPVRVVQHVRNSQGQLPEAAAHVLGASEDGSVRLLCSHQHLTTHISMILLPQEDIQKVWSETPHVTVAIARLLLDGKALVDARDMNGATPLMLALQSGKLDLALALLDAGADPNAKGIPPPAQEGSGLVLRPRSVLSDACEGGHADLTRGVHALPAVLAKLLAKGCLVDEPATAVDVSPVLTFISSGDIGCATLLLDAAADPSADAQGQNALHRIFAHVFNYSQDAENTAAMDFAMKLLSKPATGAQLLAEFTRQAPHVTPLYSLVQAYTAHVQRNVHLACTRAKILLQLLEAAPASVDFSKWTKPATAGVMCQPPQSPLSLLCVQEFFQHCPELGVKAVTLLCSRGINPNASHGSPAALHSLAERLQGGFASSSLTKVLMPLTDLNAYMPNNYTLLTFVLNSCLTRRGCDQNQRDSIKMLLEGRCDPNLCGVGAPPLHLAAQLRDEGLIKDLVAAGADANLPDKNGHRRLPLHCAVTVAPTGADANFDVEEELLRARADPSGRDALGFTALHYAFLKASNQALAFEGSWLETSAPVSAGTPTTRTWNPKAWQMISDRVDPVETISSLCVLPGIAVNAKDNSGMSPLHLAALRGASISALKLISAGAVLEDDFCGNTPLGLAMHMHPEMAVLLMQRSANTKASCELYGAPSAGRAPVRGTSESLFSLAVRQLSHKPQGGATYLGAALCSLDCGFPIAQALNDTIASRQYIMLLTLIPKVGDEVLRSQRYDGGHNLLHRMAASGHSGDRDMSLVFIRAAGKLLERGVPVATDDQGQTPLHLAALKQYKDFVNLLLLHQSANQSMVSAKDSHGRTALGCALAGCGSGGDFSTALEIAKALISHGTSASQALVCVERQTSALSFCIDMQQPPVARNQSCWPQVLFAKEPPSVVAYCSKKRSCLTSAAASQTHALSYLQLIVSWATPDELQQLMLAPDTDGRTPLMFAVTKGHVDFVDALLREAHSISLTFLQEVLAARAPDGSTALMQAVDSSDGIGTVWTLLRWMNDAAVSAVLPAVNTAGQTALMLAVLRNNFPIVQMLLQSRPLQPRPTATSCPVGKMAGDMCYAQVVYAGSSGGTSNFNLSWMSAPMQFRALPRQAHAQQADGCAKVAIYSERTRTSSAQIPSGSNVQVKTVDGEWAEIDHGWVKLRDVFVPEDTTPPAAPNGVTVHLKMPPGTGPGVNFEVTWGGSTGGPGLPGLAGGFAEAVDGPSRTPPTILSLQDKGGASALHHCVCPLPFGSFENVGMLSALVEAGLSANLRDKTGCTALDLAAKQRSGKMLKRFQELGLTVARAQSKEADSVMWPVAVDVEVDAASAVKAAEIAREKATGKPEPPVERYFQRPSANSQVVVVCGPDGGPLDLVMTKVDLSRGPCPQNVFYRMQVLHETNQDNYFLFTRWGRIGDRGQNQTSPFESQAKATAEFLKIFKSKAGNDWEERANFEKKHLKYQLHNLKYPTVAVADVLQVGNWVWLPSTTTPLQFRRILNVGASPQILRHALQQANMDQPLGMLQRKPLDDARELLGKIKVLMQQKQQESRKAEPSGERMQTILDEIAIASSRIYELMPTRNFQHSNVAPIDSPQQMSQWHARLEVTDDVTCAARLLLGAQEQQKKMSPTDYLYSALGIHAESLKEDSPELQFIERYINNTAPGECRLFSGEGAVPLPRKPERALTLAETESFLPQWQVLQEVTCFNSAECSLQQHAGVVAAAGGTLKEYQRQGEAICIRKADNARSVAPLWVRPVGADGTYFMIRLSEREARSKIGAVYRISRKDETMRDCGEKSMLLFHGSGMANCLSILSQGLRVKPPGAMHHGSAFGNGIYFANAFQKSRNYCSLDSGVGFLLLCEVSTGKTLDGRGCAFHQAVRNARIAAARVRLGLTPEVTINEHKELKAAVREIDEDIQQQGGVENLSGTGYDSFHFHSGAAPDPLGDVVHPDGYVVPCGQIISHGGGGFGGGGLASDEIIVYDPARVRVRYMLELRDGNAAELKHVKKPMEAEVHGGSDAGGPGGAGDGVESQQLLQPEHEEEEDDEQEDDEDEDEEGMSDDE